jgi:hypothetical protein
MTSTQVPIVFSVVEVTTAASLSQQVGGDITFVVRGETLSWPALVPLLASRLLSRSISSDPSSLTFRIASCNASDFHAFLSDLTETSTVLVSPSRAEFLLSVMSELDLEAIRCQVFPHIFAFICDQLGVDPAALSTNESEVYALLASRLKDIPEDAAFQILSALPSLSLSRIFRAAEFHQDSLCGLILRLIRDAGKDRELLRCVRFVDLSTRMMNRVLDEGGDLSVVLGQVAERLRVPIRSVRPGTGGLVREVRVLNVAPDTTGRINFEKLSAIAEIEKDFRFGFDFRINVTTVTAKGFPAFQKRDAHCLHHFDVVLIGGCDSACGWLNNLANPDHQVIEQTFIPYHQQGGNLLFCHDVIRAGHFARWSYFAERLKLEPIGGDSAWRTSVDVINLSPVLSFPFRLPLKMPIAKTHSFNTFSGGRGLVLGDDAWRTQGHTEDDPTFFYFIEAPGIGLIQVGHTIAITEWEWKLLVNIICNFALRIDLAAA